MSYDLHIVRTDDWQDSESNPISKEDVDRLFTLEPDLAWLATDYVDMRDPKGIVKRCYMVLWEGKSVFWWHRGKISCTNAHEAQTIKMVQIARK